MHDSTLASEGFAFYVAELKRGAATPYLAYRVFERSWMVPPADKEVVRAATIRLIETDPWFIATAIPHFLHSLTVDDLEHLTPFVGAGQPPAAVAMLRATLWFHGGNAPNAKGKSARAQLRRALGYLKKVPTKARDRGWHEMAVGCHRVLDFAAYKRAFPLLHEATDPEWRAMGVTEFLEQLARKKDWATYDRFRSEWDRLVPDHHACECYRNQVHTNDGLRAVAAGNWAAVPEALAKAADVHGCPHLNSGGPRLDLVRLLLKKKKELAAVAEYLDRVAVFEPRAKEVAELRGSIDRLLRPA